MANTAERTVAEALDYSLTDKLLDVKTTEQLIHLLDKLENVTHLLDMLEKFLERGPEIADSVNKLLVLLRQDFANASYATNIENAFRSLQRMQEFFDTPQVQQLFKSDVLDVRAVEMVGKMARSIIQASEETAEIKGKQLGLIGLLRVLADPEIQPALRFFVNFARHLSKELGNA